MRLQHLHIRDPISYARALSIQESILNHYFAYNTSRLQADRSSSTLRSDSSINRVSAPSPTLLTFQSHPTYTVGRRHLKSNPLSPSQIAFLTSNNLATFHPSPRGGLLTYHAPGQITGFLICDLRRHGISPRCHVRLLEEGVIRTLAAYKVQGVTTEDPGVWVIEQGKVTDRKICALGVHVNKGVTSHGVGLNVLDSSILGRKELYTLTASEEIKDINKGQCNAETPPQVAQGIPAEGYLSWGFSRIVACGLEGKTVTWLTRESGSTKTVSIKDVASVLAQEMARGLAEKGKLDVDGIESVLEGDILDNGRSSFVQLDLEQQVEDVSSQRLKSDMRGGLEDWVGILRGGKL